MKLRHIMFLMVLFLSTMLFLSCNLFADEKIYDTWISTTIRSVPGSTSYKGAVAVIIEDENLNIDTTMFVTENNTVRYYYKHKKDYPTNLHITIKKVDTAQLNTALSYSIEFSTTEYNLHRSKNDTQDGINKQFKKKEGTVKVGLRKVKEESFDDVSK